MTYNVFSGTLNPTQSINQSDPPLGPEIRAQSTGSDRIQDAARLQYKSSAVAEMCDYGTIDMGRKEGRCCAPFVGELGPRLTQCAWAEIYFRTKWRLHPSSRLATIGMNRKLGAVPLLEGTCEPI